MYVKTHVLNPVQVSPADWPQPSRGSVLHEQTSYSSVNAQTLCTATQTQ